MEPQTTRRGNERPPNYTGGPITAQGRRLDSLPQGAALSEAVVMCGSKSELARRLGIHRGNVSEWFRNGGVPPAYAIRINKMLGIDLVWLLQRFTPYRPKDGSKGGTGRKRQPLDSDQS